MTRRTATNLVLCLLVWGIALYSLTGNLSALEPITTGDETPPNSVADNVKQVVGGQDYRGVLEIDHLGIAYLSEYTEWLEFIPWNQVSAWKCLGSKNGESNEEDLCTLRIEVENGSPQARTHLFFKVPCEMIPDQETRETLESYDPRGHS